MTRWRFLVSALLFALAPAGACSCEEDALVASASGPGTCEPTFSCGPGLAYRLGACQVARCQDDAECCPGQRCSTAVGLCVNQWAACSDDAECEALAGQRCIDFRGGRYCGYPNLEAVPNEAGTQACAGDGECPTGTACVGRRCLSAAPCGGGCPDGEVCDIDSATCFELSSCEATCGPGEILVVADPDTMSGDACCLVECACAALPPVPVGQPSWHASLAASPEGAFVSAYDPLYGDLVLVRFDPEGTPTAAEYVDGFPTDGPVTADPSTRRGGRDRPGPDVGEHTSIARDSAGRLHVAYYDRTLRALRYARQDADGWTAHVVDAEGDAGRFTSVALAPGGRPRIAYLAADAEDPDSGARLTVLRYAMARSGAPSEARDWLIQEVDRRARQRPPCDGGCPRGEACVEPRPAPEAAACLPESSACPSCGDGEACVAAPAGSLGPEDPGGPRCQPEVPTALLDDLPLGTGLFPSLVVTATGTPVIAYYDRIDGDLRLAVGSPDGRFLLRTVDGADPGRASDVGAHVSAALAPDGRLGLAYMDLSANDLVYLEPASGLREVVDDGVSPPELRRVGADASLVFDPAGAPAIAYQDATQLDLRYARRMGSPPAWRTEVLRGGPSGASAGAASGFYASQARVDRRAYVASVDVGFDDSGNLRLRLLVDVHPLD